MEDEAKSDPQFVTRVLNLPVVNAASDQVSEVYSRTMSSHTTIKYTMETAESAIKYSAQTAQPLVDMLEKPLKVVDNFACEQLNKLETNYPIITKQPAEILDASKAALEDAKTYGISKVNEVKTYSYETVGNIKTYSIEKAQSAKDYGVEKVNAVMESEIGKQVIGEVDKLVTLTEKYFDVLIPPSECENQMETSDASKTTVERLSILSDKAHHRLRCLAIQQLDQLRSGADDKIEDLKAVLTLFKEKSINSTKNYNERMQSLCLNLTKCDEKQSPQNLQKRLLQHAQVLTKTLNHVFKQVSNFLTHVSSSTKQQFIEVWERMDNLYETFKKASHAEEISESTISYAHEILVKFQNLLGILGNEVENSTLSFADKESTPVDLEMELLISTDDSKEETKLN